MKTFKRFIAFFCTFVLLLSVGGVWATWMFSNEYHISTNKELIFKANDFEYIHDMPEEEVTFLERLNNILNNNYSNEYILEGQSIEYFLSTLDKDWTAGHTPSLGSFVGSMDSTEESRFRINALFGDIVDLEHVSFILKAEDLVGGVDDEIAIYSTTDPLNWNPSYWTPMVVGVYLSVFVPIIDENGEIIGYEQLCDSIHGYCMEVAYMENDPTPSFSTDHWRDELFYWHEDYAVPQPIVGDDRYKYECYHTADGNYAYPGRTQSWLGWINVQSQQWVVGDYMGKKAWQCMAEIMESRT